MLILAALLSGFCFGMMGVIFRWGHDHGLSAPRLAFFTTLAGTLVFSLAVLRADWLPVAPGTVWLGLLVGLSQYAVLALMRTALDLGPLTPLWCAANLIFIPSAFVSWLLLGEIPGVWQGAGMLAGIAGVVAGARSANAGSSAAVRRPWLYGVVLLSVFLLNAAPASALKVLSHDTYLQGFDARWNQTVFLALMNTGAWLGMTMDLVLHRGRMRGSIAGWLRFGGAAACFFTMGLWLMGRSAVLPAAVAFTVNSSACILTAGLVSVRAFNEKVSPAWWIMMACAAVAVLLVNFG